jgi:hypothetical protein
MALLIILNLDLYGIYRYALAFLSRQNFICYSAVFVLPSSASIHHSHGAPSTSLPQHRFTIDLSQETCLNVGETAAVQEDTDCATERRQSRRVVNMVVMVWKGVGISYIP